MTNSTDRLHECVTRGVGVENPQKFALRHWDGLYYSCHKEQRKISSCMVSDFLSTLGKLLGFFHAYIGATFIMVYKGCMILKTRGIPYYFQNFGSFHPLLFFPNDGEMPFSRICQN